MQPMGLQRFTLLEESGKPNWYAVPTVVPAAGGSIGTGDGVWGIVW